MKSRAKGKAMKGLCLMMLFCAALATDVESQTTPRVAMRKSSYSVALRGEVKSIEIKNITPSDVRLTVNLRLELLNNGSKPVIFLETKLPELRGAALAKSPNEFSASKRLVLEYYGESVDTSPEWTLLRNALNQPSPPADKVRILMPNESWRWEEAVDITLPQNSNKNYFSDKRESWENIKQLPTVWLRAICQVWPLNLELRGDEEETDIAFGHELQKRWSDVGLLWLDTIYSEPITLDLGGKNVAER